MMAAPAIALLIAWRTIDDLIVFVLFIIVGAGCLGAGLAYSALLAKRHLVPVAIDENIRCSYLGLTKQLQIRCWFDDYSTHDRFIVSCVATFGSNPVPMNDLTQIGGLYLNGQGLTRGQSGRSMAEFLKRDLTLDDPKDTEVVIRIKPAGGVLWKAVTKRRRVPVQVVN